MKSRSLSDRATRILNRLDRRADSFVNSLPAAPTLRIGPLRLMELFHQDAWVFENRVLAFVHQLTPEMIVERLRPLRDSLRRTQNLYRALRLLQNRRQELNNLGD